MHSLAKRNGYQEPTIDRTEREKRRKTENERYRRRCNRCILDSYWGAHESCGKGVASYGEVRERQKVRVSGKVAHPENQGYTYNCVSRAV